MTQYKILVRGLEVCLRMWKDGHAVAGLPIAMLPTFEMAEAYAKEFCRMFELEQE